MGKDGTTNVNLHTIGANKFKYSGDGMPPGFMPGMGMSSMANAQHTIQGPNGAFNMRNKNNL
jgi:hypothetical protein